MTSKQAVARGEIRPDKAKLERMIGGAIIEATRLITALAAKTSNNVALRDVPSMTPMQVAATVIGGSFRVDLPEVSINGAELLALIAGSEAVKTPDRRPNERAPRQFGEMEMARPEESR
jgi:hypothetical protein